MKMKKITTILATLALALSAFAQTPEEIISRMEEEMDKHESEGVIMNVDIKIPILGTISSRTWTLGDKMRMEAKSMGKTIINWDDGTTSWTYNADKNELEIEDSKPSSSSDEGDAEMFKGVTDGYDVSIKKETDDAWYIHCKKSKTNKEKDDPKNMDIVVAKGTYFPKSLSAKMSGVTLTMRDVVFGVKEEDVTFDQSKYSGATIVDKRAK
jgi:outer membrane lipoprotein-sorting protein